MARELSSSELRTLAEYAAGLIEQGRSCNFFRFRDGVFLQLLLYTGCRVKELLSASVKDFRPDNNTLMIGKVRRQLGLPVFVADNVAIFFRSYGLLDYDPIIPTNLKYKARLTADVASKLISRLTDRAGVQADGRDIRFTYAQRLLRSTDDVLTTCRTMGYSSVRYCVKGH